jgi:hypothetical protein
MHVYTHTHTHTHTHMLQQRPIQSITAITAESGNDLSKVLFTVTEIQEIY